MNQALKLSILLISLAFSFSTPVEAKERKQVKRAPAQWSSVQMDRSMVFENPSWLSDPNYFFSIERGPRNPKLLEAQSLPSQYERAHRAPANWKRNSLYWDDGGSMSR